MAEPVAKPIEALPLRVSGGSGIMGNVEAAREAQTKAAALKVSGNSFAALEAELLASGRTLNVTAAPTAQAAPVAGALDSDAAFTSPSSSLVDEANALMAAPARPQDYKFPDCVPIAERSALGQFFHAQGAPDGVLQAWAVAEQAAGREHYEEAWLKADWHRCQERIANGLLHAGKASSRAEAMAMAHKMGTAVDDHMRSLRKAWPARFSRYEDSPISSNEVFIIAVYNWLSIRRASGT